MFLVVVFLVLHAVMSYFTYYVFYVLLFWALVSGRLTLLCPVTVVIKIQSINHRVVKSQIPY